jgi:tetratricopeptide (TPR) repeat protein
LEPEQGAAWPAFSPDGRWLVIGTFGEYRFWEVGSWQREHSLPRAKASRNTGQVAFAPDSRMVAVLHDVSEVHLVDPTTGREFARLPAAGCPCCFSPDGSQLVTRGVRDGAFQVWDLRLLRKQLQERDLDWDLPPYPAPSAAPATGLRIQVLEAKPPPPSEELDAQAYVERGLLYVQLRGYAKAVENIERAGDFAPQQIPWQGVVRAVSEVLERHPWDDEAHHLRAYAYTRLGQWEKALDEHARAVAPDPPSPELLACRGRTYFRAGQKDRAAADFRKAGGRKADLANRLAWELATARDPPQREPALALELAQQAVRQVPREGTYWNTLGVANYRARKWEAAIKALEEAEKLLPGRYFGFNALFLAMCHHQLKDSAKARDYYDRAVHWSPEYQAKLSSPQQQELQAFRVEAEALLSVSLPKS